MAAIPGTLLSAVSTNGAGTAFTATDQCTVQLYGVTGGCTVHVEMSIDGTNWSPCGRPANLRQPGVINIEAHGAYSIRGVVANAGSATSVTLKAVQ